MILKSSLSLPFSLSLLIRVWFVLTLEQEMIVTPKLKLCLIVSEKLKATYWWHSSFQYLETIFTGSFLKTCTDDICVFVCFYSVILMVEMEGFFQISKFLSKGKAKGWQWWGANSGQLGEVTQVASYHLTPCPWSTSCIVLVLPPNCVLTNPTIALMLNKKTSWVRFLIMFSFFFSTASFIC